MDFNPYSSTHAEIQNHVIELTERESEITNALNWYRDIDLAAFHEKLRGLESKAEQLENETSAIESEIIRIQSEANETASLVGSLFNPGNWFAQTQVALRRRCKELRTIQRDKDAVKQYKLSSLKSVRDEIGQVNSVLQRHASFDSKCEESKLQQVRKQLVDTKQELENIAFRKMQVDAKLAPLLQELDSLISQKDDAETKLRQARDYEKRLSSASNSYERAMIHQDCENTFGTGSPRYAIGQQEKLVRRANSDCDKAKQRAEEIGRKAARIIETLVIDGNNLCYEADRFIGLLVIDTLLPTLSIKYSIVVVFDSGIRGRLKTDDSSIRKRLEKYATVHIVATRQSADETILDLASTDPHSFVLSNDRFVDFNEKPVVKENRIIRAEIVNGMVFVHDLDVNASYKK